MPASSPSWLSHRARAWPPSTATEKTICQQSKQKKEEILVFTNFHQTFGEKMKRKHFGTEFAGGGVIAVHSSASSFGKCFSY